jgi:glycosyltransferase involved in cell wall biosynthesis
VYGGLSGSGVSVRVDQYLPDLVPHDAISDHARRIHRVLRAAGHDAHLHAAHVDRSLRRQASRWQEADPPPPRGGLMLYHASTGSRLAPWLAEQAAGGARLAVDYHNVTPARFFDRWDPESAARCRAGREELKLLASYAPLAVADSAYNELELADSGYERTATCPLLIDLDAYRQPPDDASVERLLPEDRGPGSSWLFVGRIAPNKCQHDVVAAFAVFRRLHDPGARLTLVGGTTSPGYLRAVRRLCAELGVDAAVTFRSAMPHAQLLAQLQAADVFVCLSQHEGFCVPLVESMVVGLPIVALSASAVPETLASAGVLLGDNDPLLVAEAVAALLADDRRRDALVAAGRRRAEDFELRRTSRVMLDAIVSAP